MKKAELKKLVKEEFINVIRELEMDDENNVDPTNGAEEIPGEEAQTDIDVTNGEEGAEGEGGEIKSDLMFIADAAAKAAESYDGSQEPEAWVQSHIAAAKELMAHASEYLSAGQEEEPTEEPSAEEQPLEEPGIEKEPVAEAISDADVAKKKKDYLTARMQKDKDEVASIREYEQYEDESGNIHDDEGNVKRASKFSSRRGTGQLINRSAVSKAFDKEAGREETGFKKFAMAKRTQDAGQRAIDNQEPTNELKLDKAQVLQLKEVLRELMSIGRHDKVIETIEKLKSFSRK